MKVLLVSKSAKPNIGGIEIVVEQLAIALIEKNIEAIVLTQSKNSDKNYVKANLFSAFFKIAKISPNIVHIHGFRSISLPVCLASKLLGIPLIITPHFDYDSGWKNKLNVFFHKILNFNKVIALSNSEKSKLEVLGFKNVLVIPNFFDFKKLNENSGHFRKTFQIPENAFVFLFVGRLASNKGLPYLFEAFSKLNQENKFLVVVGKQDKRFNDTSFVFFNSLIEKFGIKNKAILTGRINDSMLASAFHECNAVVFPSIASEAFGLVLLQAMHCKKPVIASSLEPLKELIKHEENGLLVMPKSIDSLSSSMFLLSSSPDLCKRLAENASLFSANFSKEKLLPVIIGVYKSFP